MAKFVLKDPVVQFTPTGGTAYGTISANVAQVTLSIEADDIEVTAFDNTGWRSRIGGLKGGTFSMDVHQDMAAGSIDEQFWSSIGGTVAIIVRPGGTAAAGSANAEYSFSALCTGINPVDGAVGDLSTQSITWPITGAVTRGTGA
jgi:predicted secreted protein